MGNVNSSILCEEEIEELKNSSVFTEHEIEYLYDRFCYLDKFSVGYLTYKDLNTIPEFEMNPFNKLICNAIERIFDYQNITFLHFLDLVGLFNKKTSVEKRIRFLFDIFNLNRDGRLCKSVLKDIFEIMGCRDEAEIGLVLRTYDTKKKGYLDYKDFTNFYFSDPNIEKNMLIDFTKNIKQPTKVRFKDIIFPNFLIKKM
ncbi:putative calcineurin B subunit [Vairimorpha necatrix]|uniref:Calcineurin subunit B n=1 Tax=Vairimorpha necatrix TaxID=6039 RepID=A0AAX4J977_9MICR